ncbi:MAG: Holliday junction helicase subunit RuvA [Acidimicrobiales bacterium]|jgi:Holliday junction DNA helicase RuvA|nr:Holliday junction helicase subunit RuvA [Acidimicrobiales bacterium]
MIGSLRGTVLDRSPTEVIIDVNGVGYRVQVSPATVVTLGDLGSTVVVHTHLHVREDALTLYGFPTLDERACFEALLGAHGVGPALALAILSVHRPSTLRQALADDDVDALCLVPGVGKKTAARLLLELKSRLDLPAGDVLAVIGGGDGGGVRGEVREALVSLGYGPQEIGDALRDLPAEGDVQRLLKDALSRLATVR